MGFFPEAYAEPIDGATTENGHTAPEPQLHATQKLSSIHENLDGEADTSTSSEYVTAIYPFAAPESGDLPFEAGATILVGLMN